MISKGIITVLMLLVSCFKTAWFSSSTHQTAQNTVQQEITLVSYTAENSVSDTKEFQIPSRKKLSFDLSTGASLNITGWNKEVVSVKVNKRGRFANETVVEFNQTSSVLEIVSRYDGDRD